MSNEERIFGAPEHSKSKKEVVLRELAFFTSSLEVILNKLNNIDVADDIAQGLRSLSNVLPKLADGGWYQSVVAYTKEKVAQNSENTKELIIDTEVVAQMEKNFEVIQEDMEWAMEELAPVLPEMANGIDESIREAKLLGEQSSVEDLLKGNISTEDIRSFKNFVLVTIDNLKLFRDDILNMEEGNRLIDEKRDGLEDMPPINYN